MAKFDRVGFLLFEIKAENVPLPATRSQCASGAGEDTAYGVT
jgi:hypothetical protein